MNDAPFAGDPKHPWSLGAQAHAQQERLRAAGVEEECACCKLLLEPEETRICERCLEDGHDVWGLST